jgi:hypothetical protein
LKLAKFIIWLNSALFVLFGLGFLFLPAYLSSLITQAVPATTSGLIDMRAVYGGMSLGVGIIFALLGKTQYYRLGAQSVLAVMLAFAISRMVGIAIDGMPNLIILIMLGTELLMALLAGIAICQTTRD